MALQNLSVWPDPSGELLVQATVLNQGTFQTYNEFFITLHSRQPTGLGDQSGSVGFWVNSSIAAGQTVTATTVLTNTTGLYTRSSRLAATSEVSGTLYAQVDSTGVISETTKANNILRSPVDFACLIPKGEQMNVHNPQQTASCRMVSLRRALCVSIWILFLGSVAPHVHAASGLFRSGSRDVLQSMRPPQSPAALSTELLAPKADNPRWKILVLIYGSTDFAYTDGFGNPHRVVASMTQGEKDLAATAATRFFSVDVPALNGGYMLPILTIRYPSRTLTQLDPVCGYWPSRGNTATELDLSFDSVVVIWDSSGTDIVTGQPASLQNCGGLAIPNGTAQTYATFQIDSVASDQRNVFKHEWGHSILWYFDAAGTAPKPTVNNHINNTDTLYVHCPTGGSYILQDETDDNLIPNSIYNNDVGFTHDYYSGTTATPDQPSRCLGITPSAWASGGPMTRPSQSLTYLPLITSGGITIASLVQNGGFENGTYGVGKYPLYWTTEAWQASTSFTWDNAQARSGTKSVRINSSTANDSRWLQSVPVQPNTQYRLSGWIKTENILQAEGSVFAGANLGLYGTWDHTPGLYGTNEWTFVTMQFSSGNSTQVTVACRLGHWSGTVTGTMWCDDIELNPNYPIFAQIMLQMVRLLPIG